MLFGLRCLQVIQPVHEARRVRAALYVALPSPNTPADRTNTQQQRLVRTGVTPDSQSPLQLTPHKLLGTNRARYHRQELKIFVWYVAAASSAIFLRRALPTVALSPALDGCQWWHAST